jgi:hypothetical protein
MNIATLITASIHIATGSFRNQPPSMSGSSARLLGHLGQKPVFDMYCALIGVGLISMSESL